MADDRVLEGDPVRAEDRPRLAGDRQRLADVVELAEADLLGPDPAVVLQPPEVQGEQRPFSSSTSMSASLRWVSWKPPIGRPNCVRVVA